MRIDYSLEDLEAWSPTLELPAIPDPEAGTVFEAMLKHPRFDADTRSWRAVPYTELHATGDSDLYNERGEGWPVWKGRTFERYWPDLAEPIYWATPGPVLERLQQKRKRSRGVFGRLAQEVLNDPGTLPPHDCRVIFRDVVRANDTRTIRSCLAPPQVFAIHDAPQLIFERGEERDMLGALAVLNSLPFDWLVRRRVETHVTFSILNSLPVPEANPHWDRLAELAGLLSFVDERYTDFAQRAGIVPNPLSSDARADAEDEIDALVADGYGLDEDQLRILFRDFSERAFDAERSDRIVNHHRRIVSFTPA